MAFKALPQGKSFHRWRLKRKVQERIDNLRQFEKNGVADILVHETHWPYAGKFLRRGAPPWLQVFERNHSVVENTRCHLINRTGPTGPSNATRHGTEMLVEISMSDVGAMMWNPLLTTSSVGSLESFLCFTPIVGCGFFGGAAMGENAFPAGCPGPRAPRTLPITTCCSGKPRSSFSGRGRVFIGLGKAWG